MFITGWHYHADEFLEPSTRSLTDFTDDSVMMEGLSGYIKPLHFLPPFSSFALEHRSKTLTKSESMPLHVAVRPKDTSFFWDDLEAARFLVPVMPVPILIKNTSKDNSYTVAIFLYRCPWTECWRTLPSITVARPLSWGIRALTSTLIHVFCTLLALKSTKTSVRIRLWGVGGVIGSLL